MAYRKLERETRLARRVHPQLEVFFDTVRKHIQYFYRGKEWQSLEVGEPFSISVLQRLFAKRNTLRENVKRIRADRKKIKEKLKDEVRDEYRLKHIEKGMLEYQRKLNDESPSKLTFYMGD